MTSLAQAKAMGGIGSILVLLSPIIALTALVPPAMFFSDILLSIGIISGIAGLVESVLILVAVKRISDTVNDREIFKNVLRAVIITFVGIGTIISVVLSIPPMYTGPVIIDGDYLTEDVVISAFLDLPIITTIMLLGIWVASPKRKFSRPPTI